MLKRLSSATQVLQEVTSGQNKSMLICCRGGRHRAPQLIMYLLRILQGYRTFDAALDFVRGSLGTGAWSCENL